MSVHAFSRVRQPLPHWHRVVAARVHAHRAARPHPTLRRRLELVLIRVDVWIVDHPEMALTVALVAAPFSVGALLLVVEVLLRWVL